MDSNDAKRVKYIYLFFAFCFIAIALRISYLQIFRKNFFQRLAYNQHYRLIPLAAKRGKIIDSQGRVIATGIYSYSIFADPLFIKKPTSTAKILSQNLGISENDLRAKLAKKKRFIWVKRKVSWSEKEKIKKLKLKGISFIREVKRFYPQDAFASSLLGAVDIDNKGLGGLELYYDRYLRGKDGWVRILQDSNSRELILSPQRMEPQEGANLILTIDAQIQYWAENYLTETIEKFDAKEGGVVVMDSNDGSILAFANYPNYNPNKINPGSLDLMRNRIVSDMFEPGSVFKIVTLAAALEEKKFSDNDNFFCGNGTYKIPGATLHDWHPYGNLSFREVFKKSSNIGVAKIANAVGKEKLYSYIKKMGFGDKTGIDFPGEIPGNIKPLSAWSKTSPYIMPIGQEVGVTLVQLARSIAVIANGGYLVKPHIVKSITSENILKDTEITKKAVISSKVAQHAKEILIDVVNDGTGKLAGIEGVKIGGKTGTAQKFDVKTKHYSPDRYRASFIGFVDGINRPIVIAVSVDEPRKSHFGGVVTAPLFKKIAQSVIKYFGEEEMIKAKTK